MNRPPTTTLSLLVLATLILGACGQAAPTAVSGPTVSAPPAASVAPTASPTALPSPTATSLPTLTPEPTAKPTLTLTYAPRPTATPYQAPAAKNSVYTFAANGVSLNYPRSWQISTDSVWPNVLAAFTESSKQYVGAYLYSFDQPASLAFEEAAPKTHQRLLKTYFKDRRIRNVSDGAVTLKNGQAAWTTLVIVDGTLKINWISAASGQYLYTLMVAGSVTDYSAYADDIAVLTNSLRVERPTILGFPRDQVLVIAERESSDGRNYDPATTERGGDKLVFSGLVALDTDLKLIPDLAESWAMTGGTTYTFKLRANARFHNGKPVTAHDFIYAWERAADPQTKSGTVLDYLGDIAGVRDMQAGKASHISGLAALDDHTLQVTIDSPKPYFLYKLTYPTAAVVDRLNIEAGPTWYRMPNGTGPYRLARWEPGKMMVYERNDDFYLKPPAIPYIVKLLDYTTEVGLYEAGQVDVAQVSLRDLARLQDPQAPLHADLQTGDSLCTGYIVFDVTQPPFDDVKVRQAFSLAFDRQKYIDTALDGLATPAEGLYPPGLPGYNPDLNVFGYDPDRARQLLAESKYGGPASLPPIIYTEQGYGAAEHPDIAAVVQMWQQTFGITITVENIAPENFQAEINAGRHGQLVDYTWDSWCADYPDPENFADMLFHTGAQLNRGHYSNPEVDALLEQARVEPDTAARLALYQRVEQLIVDDAPVLFTDRMSQYALVQPHVQGYVLPAIDISLARYLWIDPDKLKW
jgi:oligopeptide transport system substrate-binding protein